MQDRGKNQTAPKDESRKAQTQKYGQSLKRKASDSEHEEPASQPRPAKRRTTKKQPTRFAASTANPEEVHKSQRDKVNSIIAEVDPVVTDLVGVAALSEYVHLEFDSHDQSSIVEDARSMHEALPFTDEDIQPEDEDNCSVDEDEDICSVDEDEDICSVDEDEDICSADEDEDICSVDEDEDICSVDEDKRLTANTKAKAKRPKNSLNLGSPPMNSVTEMFDHLTKKAFTKLGLDQAVEYFENRPVLVATMCSGTESPLLALQLVDQSLQKLCGKNIHTEHIFSGEIVPYKQAYIERNFAPNILFRDITELCDEDEATTAYGQLVMIPPFVDILVAGFSCVDFSMLNRQRKTIDDGGESAATFRAICLYIKRYRPAVCIIENVKNAPWIEMELFFQNKTEGKWRNCDWSLWDLGDLGYAAKHVLVDTKSYYIPQTRQRGYMILMDRKHPEADKCVTAWQGMMRELKRPASSPFEDFLMKGTDVNLLQARADMANGQGRETDWTLCRERYWNYRQIKELGIQRPLTQWKNGGSCQAPDHWWSDWLRIQVERIYDSLDINHLYSAAFLNIDNRYKTRTIELSQNVDRAVDTKQPGFISCLTPTGCQFITSEGRPLTGREALALQGLPVNKLLLTRESQKEQLDLAGNAMTTTVVGAALVSAFIVGYKAIDMKDRVAKLPTETTALPAMDSSALDSRKKLNLDHYDTVPNKDIQQMAEQTARLCVCEGQKQTVDHQILICKDCRHTSCRKCSGIPKHNYMEMVINSRKDPSSFTDNLKWVLPMRLKLTGINVESPKNLRLKYGVLKRKDWEIFYNAVTRLTKEEYRFSTTIRSRQWIVTYDASRSYLELVIHQDYMYWQVYGKPSPKSSVNSLERKLLKYPLARLELDRAKDLLEGQWKLNLPVPRSLNLKIKGIGKLVPSWEAELGIEKEELENKKVFNALAIEINNSIPFAEDDPLISRISGTYIRYPDCGTSFNSLHKQICQDSSEPEPLFFWLDPDRNGPKSKDFFSFSQDLYHQGSRKQRYELASINSAWRPSQRQPEEVKATAYGLHVGFNAELQAFGDPQTSFIQTPKKNLSISITHNFREEPSHKCSSSVANALLHVEIPVSSVNRAWGDGSLSKPKHIDERQELQSFAWITERAQKLDGFSTEWRKLEVSDFVDKFQIIPPCQACSPKVPDVRWRPAENGSSVVPVEDGQQAGAFERAMKSRTRPFVIYTWTEEPSAQGTDDLSHETRPSDHLMIGLNIAALSHRVLAKFNDVKIIDVEKHLYWRLDTEYRWPLTVSFPKFSLMNNKNNLPAQFSFSQGRDVQLREEQLKSLEWMINQERNDPGFLEQEIEEVHLYQLNWRAEVRFKKPCLARGGLLADEVGYGKTATTLALIHQTRAKAEYIVGGSSDPSPKGTIGLKASLIIVPNTLVHQWVAQIDKFLGKSYKIVIIRDMKDYKNTTVRTFRDADIVLVSSNIFTSTTYRPKVAEMAAMPACYGSSGTSIGRDFKSWLNEASKRIATHTAELVKRERKVKGFDKILQQRLEDLMKKETTVQPTKRHRGAKFVAEAAKKAAGAIGEETASPPKLLDTYNFRGCRFIDDVQGPILQMFCFHRLIVDEYTYIGDIEMSLINAIQSPRRWILSGTPHLGDFRDVQTIASFLGVNLGIYDDSAMALKAHSIKKIRDGRSSLEQFQAFSETRTPAWHMQRHEHAQHFLDCFARQNKPEIGQISMNKYILPVRLSAVERALYNELEQYLETFGFIPPKILKDYSTSDRTRRLRYIMDRSRSPEEALLKRCSQLLLSTSETAPSDTATESSGFLYSARLTDFKACSKELKAKLKEAQLLQMQYDSSARGDDQPTDFKNWQERLNELESDTRGIVEGKKLQDLANGAIQSNVQSEENDPELDAQAPKEDELAGEDFTKQAKQQFQLNVADFKKRMLTSIKLSKKIMKVVGKGKAGKVLDKKEESDKNEESDGEETNMKIKVDRKRKPKTQIIANPPKNKVLKGKVPKNNKGPDDNKESFDDDIGIGIINAPTKVAGKEKTKPLSPQNLLKLIRSTKGTIAVLETEYQSRFRSLRYSEAVHKIDCWLSGIGAPPRCDICKRQTIHPEAAFLFSFCGHLICNNCLQNSQTITFVCLVKDCKKPAEEGTRICPATIFRSHSILGRFPGLNSHDAKATGFYGAKVDAVVKLLKNDIPEDNQVLLFMQYSDLMINLMTAFDSHGVSYLAILDSSADSATIMQSFQDDVSKFKKQVLILDPTNETAAGANLTNANHLIFVSATRVKTDEEYVQARKQCIGRANRWGQKKIVYVYTMLALNTIDVDIIQTHSKRRLVRNIKDGVEEWGMESIQPGNPFVEWGPIIDTDDEEDTGKGNRIEEVDEPDIPVRAEDSDVEMILD